MSGNKTTALNPPGLLCRFIIVLLLLSVSFSAWSGDITAPLSLLKRAVLPLAAASNFQPLVDRAGQAQVVLIGDSTHGTQEFYQQRITISQRLIEEQNFKLLALEGDWPNVYLLNQYIRGNSPLSAKQTLDVFIEDAAWLWGNQPMLEFIQWLKAYNASLPAGEQKVSIYGLDIYSFHQSRQLVVDYLRVFSSQAAQQANRRYQCFERFDYDLHRYGRAIRANPSLSCESPVLEQYSDFAQCRLPCPQEFSVLDRDAFFYAMQNARVVKNIEQGMRDKYLSGQQTALWNHRDRHMMETLLAAMAHLQQPKTLIWAHNSHLGDARATDMARFAQLNLGQLVRQHFGQQAYAIGMLTYAGTVMAADDWNRPARLKTLRPAHPDSNEALFHRLGMADFLLFLQQPAPLSELLEQSRLQRHVGAVYRPDEEMQSHYTYAHLARQFDAIIYNDMTTAIRSLTFH